MLGAAVVPNPERTLQRTVEIAGESGVAWNKGELRNFAFSSLGIPVSVLEHMNLGEPFAMVYLDCGKPEAKPDVLYSLAAKSAKDAKQAIKVMGEPVATKGDASAFRMNGELHWFWQKDERLVVANSSDALVKGALLAIELANPGANDIVVWAVPPAIFAWQQKNPGSVKALVRQQIQPSLQAVLGPLLVQSDLFRAFLDKAFGALVDLLFDVPEVRLAIRGDSKDGVLLRLSVMPKAGSALAARIARSTPYQFDRRVLTGDPPDVLLATAPMPLIGETWRSFQPLLAESTDWKSLVEPLDIILSPLTGATSIACRLTDRGPVHTAIFEFAKGTDTDRYLDAAARLSDLPSPMNSGPAKEKLEVTSRRANNMLLSTVKYLPESTDPEMRQGAKLSSDGDSFTSAVLVEGDKAYAWLAGTDAENDVKFLPKAIPGPPQRLVARALEESKGSDGLFYIDIAWAIRAALASMPPSSFKYPQLSSLQLPSWVYFRGGTTFDVLLRAPIELGKGRATLAPILLAAKKGTPDPGNAQAPPTPRSGGGGVTVFADGTTSDALGNIHVFQDATRRSPAWAKSGAIASSGLAPRPSTKVEDRGGSGVEAMLLRSLDGMARSVFFSANRRGDRRSAPRTQEGQQAASAQEAKTLHGSDKRPSETLLPENLGGELSFEVGTVERITGPSECSHKGDPMALLVRFDDGQRVNARVHVVPVRRHIHDPPPEPSNNHNESFIFPGQRVKVRHVAPAESGAECWEWLR
jgi:hypothetical protein